jgi:hypothetical protein
MIVPDPMWRAARARCIAAPNPLGRAAISRWP